ncbi:hypothetical protein F4827_006674 [Paraburkholderia bannensis]|uniref:Uncharacterized protein n=1 Tax=Paraburkholderia bannensis TaxID=765414 RepID=A0A7W9WWQ5_9BURK|nr:hypothetical protein [Paraburkholderia sp. WP4_3_2]MBB6106797.1 hypothetical protein [Paraburkholderia bannensis]
MTPRFGQHMPVAKAMKAGTTIAAGTIAGVIPTGQYITAEIRRELKAARHDDAVPGAFQLHLEALEWAVGLELGRAAGHHHQAAQRACQFALTHIDGGARHAYLKILYAQRIPARPIRART